MLNAEPNFYGAIAVHPTEQDLGVTLQDLTVAASNPKVVAIGETGLDFFNAPDEEEQKRQCRLFETHIEAAINLKKPLMLHIRAAYPKTLEVLRAYRSDMETLGGVVHCFCGDEAAAHAFLDLGWHLSFSGILTFKKSEELRQIFQDTPLERILLETDAPYLAPVPKRGQTNQPAFLPYTAALAANLKNITPEELAQALRCNFMQLFKVELPLN